MYKFYWYFNLYGMFLGLIVFCLVKIGLKHLLYYGIADFTAFCFALALVSTPVPCGYLFKFKKAI